MTSSSKSTSVDAHAYLYPVPETGIDCLTEGVKLKPLCDDPDCWEVCEEATLLVVEDDRDAIYLKLLSLEPINGRDGCSIVGPREAFVPADRRLEVEDAIRSQFRGRHAWLHLLCVRFDDDADRPHFEHAMARITGIPLKLGADGHREHDTSVIFDQPSRPATTGRSFAQVIKRVVAEVETRSPALSTVD